LRLRIAKRLKVDYQALIHPVLAFLTDPAGLQAIHQRRPPQLAHLLQDPRAAFLDVG
jgi:hypothetical protein